MRTGVVLSGIAAASLLLAACTEDKPAGPAAGATARADRPRVAPEVLARGEAVFKQNCAACHGARAEGAPQWQKRGPDGKYPAPPLNGTGHAWHHPTSALKATIRNGTVAIGGSMPPWRDKLSEPDVEAVISWFQSHWPDEVHAAWRRMDEQARRE